MSTATATAATRGAARVVDAVKVYGVDDAAVRAPNGVGAAVPAGRFTAVKGPSGSPRR